MTLSLIDGSKLTVDQIAPYWPDIVACIEKYCARFPEEETPENVVTDVIEGRRKMWLILDEETNRVILAPITAIETLSANGSNRLLLAECGGSRLKEAMPLLEGIEHWAKEEHGAISSRIVARKGWRDYLEPLGYKAVAVVYEKGL